MAVDERVQSLYNALKADGADVGTVEEFNEWFFKPGEEGYNNRKYVYDTFKADGADVGKDYNEFARWLNLAPVDKSQPGTTAPNAVQQQDAAAGSNATSSVGKLGSSALGGAVGAIQAGSAINGALQAGAIGGAIGALQAGGQQNGVATGVIPASNTQQIEQPKQEEGQLSPKSQPRQAELSEKEIEENLAFMREANKSRGDILEAAPQVQSNNGYSIPKMDKVWKLGYSQSWGKIKGLFDGLDYEKKDVTADLDDAVKSRYDSMSDQAIESELQKLSKEYKAGQWEGDEDALRALISRLQFNLVAHEYGFKDFKDLLSRRGEAEFEMYKYHPAFEQEWLATYKGGPGENPLLNWGKEIVKKQLIEDIMNGVNHPAGYYHSLPFSNEEFSKRYASWALKRAKALGNMGFADVYNNGIKTWESYIGAGLLESGAEEAMAQGAGYRDVGVAGGKYNSDFDAAAATAWNMAEDEYRRLANAHSDEIWGNYASMGGGREGRIMASSEWAVSNMADDLTSHDLDKMIDNAWNALGETKRKQIMLATSQNLMKQYPGIDPAKAVKAAQAMVRQQTIQRVLDYAKQQNAPKNVVDYFARKVLSQNSIIKIQEAMARSRAGTTGDWQVREQAMQEYGKNHRVAGVAGTVVGMGLDPVTYISAGVGKGAATGAVKLIEKAFGTAGRKWLTTTAGKVVIGAAGGAGNLGAFEGLNEALEQLRWGGAQAVDLNTGLIKTTGYDAGKVGKAFFHGSTMGAGTGIVAPLMGNVWSPFMEATSSTAGKMGVKAGELFTGTIAEGTIFSIPDVFDAYTESEDIIKSFSDKKSRNYIADEQERAKAIAKVREQRNETMLDAWTESVATMAGFKAKHIAERLYEVSKSGNGRVGFETRLRYMLDRKPDLALTKDEQAELERGGYTDLKELVNEYVKAEKNRRANSKPVVTGRPRTMELGTREEDMPYNRFVDLMNDGSISEAARAKMYYYITGHALPMSTVMYGQLTENKDRDGNVKGYTVQSIGANGVVTSREFTSRKRAENELQKVNRQIELNTIDVGERYNESVGAGKRMEQACKNVAKEAAGGGINFRFGENSTLWMRYYNIMQKNPEEMSAEEQGIAQKIREAYDKLGGEFEYEDYAYEVITDETGTRRNIFGINTKVVVDTKKLREDIGQKYGVDVEKALKKEPKRRSTGEQMALDEYMRRLFPEKEAREEDAEDVTFSEDTSVTDETTNGFTDEATDEGDAIVVETLSRTGEDGMVHPAVLKGEDESQVNIVSGNVVTLADGTIDVANSDQDIIIVDAKGQRLMININDIASIGTPIDPNAAMAAAEQANAAPGVPSGTGDTAVSQAANTAAVATGAPGATQGGATGIEVGGRYQVADGEGTHEVEVLRDNGNGSVEVSVDGEQHTMGVEQLQQMLGIVEPQVADEEQPQPEVEVETPNDEVPAAENDMQPAAVDVYRIADDVDDAAITDAGFSRENIQATADYLNGKIDERAYLERLGFDKDVLAGIDDDKVSKWVEGVANRASEFLTDKPVESGDVRVESDEVPADASTTLTPTPQPEAADATEVEATTEPMPLFDDGNPNYAGTTPERGRQYIYDESGLDKGEADAYVSANLASAEKDLDKIKKKPPKMGTNLVKYQKDKADWESRMQEAQSNVDYWNKVKASQADYEAEQAKARKAADAEVRAQAVVDEQARQAAELAKQQEQAERGAGAVHPAIAEKWNNAPKIEGYKDEVVLANGERVPGTYYLVESGAVTPSHNASREFEKYEGFPVDENGNTINDRDYERDKDAQNITRSIADNYDSRALQTPVIVSKDGVVLSGNGRTMAGELAASNNTDGAYIEHLKNYGRKYGFSPEQVDGMQHPRAVFVPDADMPYTTETFAKFNAQEMKGQSKTEQAVKLGKVVDDATFNQVVRAINEHETLGDFYGDTKAATEAINALRRAGAINDMQYAEMFDGDAVSDRGRQIIENMLIGKAFEGNPDVIRQLTEIKSLRQSVVTALNEITTNKALGKEYSLEKELAQAVDLAYKARKAGYKENEPVSPYATQLNLFPFEDGETVADYNNVAVLELADLMNDKRPTQLKKKLQDYNQQSAESAAGQMDIFSGGVKEKKEIIKTVLNTLHNGETEEASRPEQRGSVADERGGEASLQENGAADTGSAALATPQAEPSIDAAIVEAGKETNTEPTDAQKEAGNYKKGHVKIDGFDVSIEQPKGSVRSGVDATGKAWSQKMNNTYGYIRGTEGVDGDHIDVFLSDNLDDWNGTVYVIDQVEKGGIFDEHKVMYGFNSEEDARKAYLSNYEDGWDGLGAITAVSKDEFKKWIESSHRKTKPFAEYKNVKVGGTQEQEPKQQGTLFPATEQQPSSKSETKPRTTEKQPAEAPKERIDDVGEKIEGAKKDLAKKMGERINLDADTFPKMFPKYDLKKLISQGLDPNLAVMTKMLRQMAQADYKHYSKKRMYGKSYALRAARFYAAYAKQVLEAGDSNVDFKSEGLGFTDYGKQFVELNKRLFEELYNKLGDDLFDLDLAGVKIQPLSQKEGSTWFRRNQETGEMEPYNPAYAFVGPRGQNYYEANELDKALQEGVEQLTKSIDYKKAHPYKLGHYYKPGIKNSDYVGVKLGGKIVPLTEPMTSSEVRKYMSEHNAELQAKAAQLDEQRKLDKKKGGTGEGRWKPELTLGGGRPRVGVDRRGGVDVEPEEFRKAFSFRGVQFGNYVTQRERQRFLNEAYDALMDMAELLGISPRAIAIDGRLGFAIGARGGGKANAHYEPKENVINLTKSKGAGSLAHEWFHALDYYFNRGNKKPTASTANKSIEQFPASTRNEMRKAFLDLMSAIKNSDYFKRSENLEMKLRSGKLDEGYYDKPTELAARAFQDYVVRKLADQGKINDFLSSFTSEEEWNGEPENYPFPIGAEAEKIDEKFDALFDAMQERTDEEGNTILYHLGKDHDVLTDTEIALRDGLVDVMRSVGIDVETDEAKGQNALDSARRAVELLDEMKKKSAPETAPLTNTGGSSADISSADGAKILQNIETLAKKYENISNYRKNFLDELAVAIGAKEEPTKKKKKDEVTSNSKYATFKTLAGTEVTIRLANHNATVSNFDNNGEQEGISIVISKRANQGITNNGNAHIVEFFYPEIGLRKAEGKPLVEIILSLGQALRSGEYKDTTGLATPQEVNGTMLQEMRGWHGSAAEFDEFDHSHMSEGEGNQAIGYGTYIASIEEIGRYYGTVAAMQKRFRAAPGYGDYDHYWKGQKIDLSSINPLRMAYDIVQREGTIKKAITMVEKFVDNPEAHEGWRSALDILRESRKSDFKRKRANYEGERYLYEVDIPENDGTNYLPWDEPLSDAMRERIAQGLRDMGVDLNEPFERRTGKADNFDFLDEQMSEHPITGQELYYKLVDRFGRYPQQASEFLNKYCGLVGIEYPSNFFSGGNKKGLKNHVIFNEKDIKIDNRTQYFISADGVVYGFVKDGKIYIDPKIATAETPIHEYCHLWGDALKEANPEAWERLKETMLGEKDVLDYVKKMYPGLEGDALVSEVFSHYSGRRGAERLRADMERDMKNAEGVFAKARVARVFDIIKRALSRFWTMARDLFAGKTRGLDRLTAEDFADMAMSDLLRGFNPRKKVSGETFYSNAERAVENIKQNKATAEQWKAMLTKAGGIKAGEDKWMGLSTWLDENKGKSLTKDEVLQFVRDNGIQMEEVNYSEDLTDSQREKFNDLRREFELIKDEEIDEMYEAADEEYGEFLNEMRDKYGEEWEYEMDEDERAREAFLLERRERYNQDSDDFDIDKAAFDIMRRRYGDDFASAFEVYEGDLYPIIDVYGDRSLNDVAAHYLGDEGQNINSTRLNYTTEGLDNKREIAFKLPNVEPYQEHDDIHFGPENQGKAVMWVRFGETTDADGKRVLVIDEIQSNRHQDAREKGYFDKAKKYALDEQRAAWNIEKEEIVKNILHRQGYAHWADRTTDLPFDSEANEKASKGKLGSKEEMEKVRELNEKIEDSFKEARALLDAVPAAPFEKNWHEVAMKRMLRLAAEEGFDKVAWTTGEQQAERYNLGGMVDELYSYQKPDGERVVTIYFTEGSKKKITLDKDGKVLPIGYGENFAGRHISEVVGKSVADKIMSSTENDLTHPRAIKGEDLRIGGEGMKGFYDQMLPRFMDKYGKRWGVKTGTVELPNVEKVGRTMHSVDVTPAMRASVMSGQPMFQKAAPNDNFEDVPGLNKEHEVKYGDTFRNVEEANKYVEDLPRQWNIPKDFATYHALGSKTALEDFISRASLSKEDADVLRENYYDDDVLGCGSPDKDMVILFTEKFKSKKVLANIAAHETFHVAYKYLGRDEHNRFNNAILNWFRSQSWGDKFVEALHQSYDTSKWATETMAYFVGHEVGKYGWDKFLSGEIDYGNEEIHNFVSRFKNIITNGNISQISGEPRGEALSDVERAGQRGRQPRERGSNEQSDDRGWQRASSSLVNEDEVAYGEVDDSGISDEELAGYDAGRYSFAESITQGLVDLAVKNSNDQQLRLNAMREFGGNLAKLNKIMNKQKAYDKATVDDIVRLARMVISNGFFKDMSAYEVKRLLAAIKKGVGAENLTPIANNVVDMLVSHQLRESKAALAKLMQIKGRKVDARGIEVQAGLDIDGQRMMSALKDGMSLGENGLSTRINDCENRLDSQDETVKKNAVSEYQGLMLAKEYHDNILSGEEEEIVLKNEKRQEEEKIYDFRREAVLDDDGNAVLRLDGEPRTIERKTLKPQFKNNVTDENKQLRRNTEAAIERIEQSIRESRMERVTAYSDFISDVVGDVRASRERAAAWRDEQLKRVEEIHHNANSDLQGIDPKSQTKEKKFVPIFNPKNDLVRGLFMPLATFEKFMRFFGRRFHNGEGYLFDRYVRGMIECSDKEWRSKRAAHEELDAKVKEVFDGKAKRWSDLFALERKKKYPTIPVEYWDNGERVRESLSQGEALSLYVWSKQKDAEAGLRRMGISEEDMETLKGQLNPKFVELADWVVSDFLPKRREYYNEVYERMFGAPMAAIENYFPIVRNSRDVEKPTDVTERDMSTANASTITGSFIKRVRTAAALDIHTDFFSHLLKHLDDMEHIAAWAEFNRDLNTLRNYKRFKNRVSNMNSFEFGAGKDLWKAFDNCCAIVAGVYEGNAKSKLDKITLNINKGFTGGAIAFRFNTALKQLLSLPAFWSDASADQLLLYQTNPVGNFIAWKWAMQNLPGFSKRWQSRQVGDTRLMDTDMDWKLWRNKYMKYINRGGMLANAFVDAVTVASGAKAVYETKKRRYKNIGYTDEQAERKALQDAAISYNGSQQSSESGFVSEMQVDRTFLNNMLTIFRNSPFSYGRKMTTGLRELKKRLRPGYKSDFIEAEAKKMEREGIPEDNAKKAARRLYRFGGLHAIFDVFNYGYLLGFLWTVLGGSAWYLLFGEDDEKKKEIIKDGTRRLWFSPLEGFTGGNTLSEKGGLLLKYASDEDGAEKALEDFVNWSWFTTPMEGETDNFLRDVRFDEQKAMWDVLSLAIQANLGFKPETFTDGVAAIVDYCDGDPQTSKEFLLCFMRVMQVPQSQTDNVYIDELGMTAKDAQKLNAMEMADRYAKYKRRKNDPLSYITHSEDEQNIYEKYRKRFLDNMKERMMKMDEEQLNWNFDNPNDSERRKAVGKVYSKQNDVKGSAWNKPGSNWKPETRRAHLKYQRNQTWEDLVEDTMLDLMIQQAENRGDNETAKALRDGKKKLTEIKHGKHTKTIDINGLGEGGAEEDKAIMEELRARRKEILREYGILK